MPSITMKRMSDPDAKEEPPLLLDYARPVANRSFEEALTEFVIREREENLKRAPSGSRRWEPFFSAIVVVVIGVMIAIAALLHFLLQR
jgi:hypothetical protein